MELSDLFSRCTEIPYTHTENGGDFATERMGETLYLYFQESDGMEDWQNNLDFPARAMIREGETVAMVHRGFLRVWESILPQIDPLLREGSLRRIISVGYSHGAALAALCHEQVWWCRPALRERIEGYGFGSPRVLFGLPFPSLTARWQRFRVIRNIDDPVTHLPPAYLGFWHVGELLTIGRKGAYQGIDAHRKENILRELKVAEQEGSLRLK